MIPQMTQLYQTIGELLLERGGKSRLGFLRCDAFELLEDAKALSLGERPFSEEAQPGAVKLLAGLLRHNTQLEELDLTAADLEDEGVRALASILEFNSTLTSLQLRHNPALSNEVKETIREAAATWSPALKLEL